MNIKGKALTVILVVTTLNATSLMAQEWEGKARDAWIDGKLESSYLLNTELNNFRIDTSVENGEVTLTGTVDSTVHKALAEEIAHNLEGVAGVDNQLGVGESDYSLDAASERFSTTFFDMTTTAGLKSRYALNPELKALDINVDTQDGVVLLEGEVQSRAAKQLAEEIATGYDHVTRVDNRLQIVSR